jgi:hypothetical protein
MCDRSVTSEGATIAVSPVHLTWQPFQNSFFCNSVPRAPGLPSCGATSTPASMP